MIRQRWRTLGSTLGLMAVGLSAPAWAHHSFAMFEREKTVMLSGAVTDFQFTNPHAWIYIRTSANQEWKVEAGSPNMMRRQGWSGSSIKAGDKVGMVIRPMRDGSAIGSLISVTLGDGRVLGPGGAPAPETGNAPRPQ